MMGQQASNIAAQKKDLTDQLNLELIERKLLTQEIIEGARKEIGSL